MSMMSQAADSNNLLPIIFILVYDNNGLIPYAGIQYFFEVIPFKPE